MRYVEPDATNLARFSDSFFKFGDCTLGVFAGIGALSAGITGAIITFTVHFLLILLVIPLAVYVAMFVSWQKHTVTIGTSSYRDSKTIVEANRLWQDIRGEFTEDLALLIMRKIYTHAALAHDYWGDCRDGSCEERIDVLRMLVPVTKSVTNKSDIHQAMNFIEARKEIESL